MAQGVILSQRDLALLRLLDLTPATATHIRKASVTFDGDNFRDERRVRERLQALGEAGLIRSWSIAIPSGGLMSYFRLTLNGHRAAFPDEVDSPPRTSLSEIAPSRVRHAMATAEMIVHSLVACHERGVVIQRTLGDGRLTLQVGEYRQQPDYHLQLGYAGRTFNLVFEIDNATEPLDSRREQSIRTKILGYETYQDWVLRRWKETGEEGSRPNTVRHDIRGSRTEEMAGCLEAEERLPVWRDGRGRHAHKLATAQQQATRVAGQECDRGLWLSVFSRVPRLVVLVS